MRKRDGELFGGIIAVIIILAVIQAFWKPILTVLYIFIGILVLSGIIKLITYFSKKDGKYKSGARGNSNKFPPQERRKPDFTQQDRQQQQSGSFIYKKKRLMINSELEFWHKFNNVLNKHFPDYYIFPQITISVLLEKISDTEDSDWKNVPEYYRVPDFTIFKKDNNGNYQPKFVIEINGEIHKTDDKKEKDKKLEAFCLKAGLGYLAFWLYDSNGKPYPNTEDYIKNKFVEKIKIYG